MHSAADQGYAPAEEAIKAIRNHLNAQLVIGGAICFITLRMIGYVSAETTLNIYSHITDTMRQQAAVKIDREIGGCDTQMPTEDGIRIDANPTAEIAAEEEFEPCKGKIRKPGTGRISEINDHLYEGRFTPTVGGKRVSKNIYAKTREECEEKLTELIKVTKAEIAEMKANATTYANVQRGDRLLRSPLKIYYAAN